MIEMLKKSYLMKPFSCVFGLQDAPYKFEDLKKIQLDKLVNFLSSILKKKS